jgi:hypothetical protein
MRRGISKIVVSQAVAITVVFAAPSAAFAEGAPWPFDQSAVPAATTRARRPFDGEALRRAIETALRVPAPGAKQAPPVAAGRDSLWNGVLIGAGIGAVAGGLSAASGDCDGPDYVGACDFVAVPAIGAGILLGGLLGAGVGAIVDMLIR